ncbi:hypothetical protein C7D73_30500, partial [Klebsiella pneumoniae]
STWQRLTIKQLNRAFRLLAEGVRAGDVAAMRADSESSAVTVKLTDINEYLAEVNDKTAKSGIPATG